MGLFERYLTLWVALGMCAGIGLGLVEYKARKKAITAKSGSKHKG